MRAIRFLLVLLPLLLAAAPGTPGRTLEMRVDGMVCAYCMQGIEKKFRSLGATDDIYISLENGLVAVRLKPGQDISEREARTLLQDAGYSLRSVRRTDQPLAALRARPQP
ncbi:MAG TPA: heavy-metal-associated domain-containing protein [Candidatus Binatia bacterium]|nr:heavy-metal-associated domain-containing protein [Candidatus Binatia bacterium]